MAGLPTGLHTGVNCVALVFLLFLGLAAAGTKLFYVDRANVRSVDLDTDQRDILVPARFKNAIAIDFDFRRSLLYVCDIFLERIFTVDLSGDDPVVEMLVNEDVKTTGGLAVDWVNNKLYWTDSGEGKKPVL